MTVVSLLAGVSPCSFIYDLYNVDNHCLPRSVVSAIAVIRAVLSFSAHIEPFPPELALSLLLCGGRWVLKNMPSPLGPNPVLSQYFNISK